MKSSLLLFIGVVAIACQSKTTTEVTSDSLAVESGEKPYSEFSKNNSTYKVSQLTFDALILPPATLYKDSIKIPNQKPDILTLAPVTVLRKTKTLSPPDDDLCKQFPFIEVRFALDSTGWVYGDQVMVPEQTVASIELEGVNYSLRLASDAGIGASTEEGSTGCNEYRLLYLVSERDSLIHLVTPYKNLDHLRSVGNTDLGWFSFVSNEGVSTSVTSVEGSGNTLKLNLHLEYQEGKQQATVHLRKETGDFVLYLVELGKEMNN